MPSDPVTWADLKTRLADWLDRDDLNATTIPEAIALAERRFQRTLFGPEREIVADFAIDSESEALPVDCWGIKALHLATDPKTVLEPMTLAELRNTYAANTTGRPQNYAIYGETILFGPAPDAAYTGRLTYIQSIPALGASQATNWLLTDHPDVYMHGALHELYIFLADEARAGLHDGKFRELAGEIADSAHRRLQGGAPIRIRPPSLV